MRVPSYRSVTVALPQRLKGDHMIDRLERDKVSLAVKRMKRDSKRQEKAEQRKRIKEETRKRILLEETCGIFRDEQGNLIPSQYVHPDVFTSLKTTSDDVESMESQTKDEEGLDLLESRSLGPATVTTRRGSFADIVSAPLRMAGARRPSANRVGANNNNSTSSNLNNDNNISDSSGSGMIATQKCNTNTNPLQRSQDVGTFAKECLSRLSTAQKYGATLSSKFGPRTIQQREQAYAEVEAAVEARYIANNFALTESKPHASNCYHTGLIRPNKIAPETDQDYSKTRKRL